MYNLAWIIVLAGWMAVAAGETVPEYYRILADDCELANTGVLPGRPEPTLWQPVPEESANGFAAALVDTEETPSPHWIWRETNPRREFHFISLLEEYRAQPLAVRCLRPLEALTVEGSDLVNAAGDRIGRENWDVRVVKNLYFQLENGPRQDSNLLMKGGARDWPADITVYYWLTIYTPAGTAPGLYSGTVTLRTAAGGEQILPVKLRVLEKNYRPPAGEWGMWIPGHFYRPSKGYCRNYAPEWWTPDRIVDYFRFWKTRGFTSPTYSGWYPQIALVDGEIQIDFAEMDQLIAAPAQAGLTGQAVIGDTLLFEYWAHAAALQIQSSHQGEIPRRGTLGIRSDEALSCLSSGQPYGPLEAELFTAIMKKVMAHGREAGWPRMIFYPEEEIGNQPFKVAGYDFFMPLLRNAVGPEHCITIDNNIGHMNDRLDRGKRDHSRYRAYNAWDQPAIDDAKQESAAIWTFNRGFLRSAWGHYLQRIDATGCHQWADNWDGGSYGVWFNSIAAGDGKVLTSVNYERAALGLRDLALLRELADLGGGYAAELAQINAVVQLDLLQDRAQKYYHDLKDSDLEARRWQTLLALSRAGRLKIPLLPAADPAPALVSAELLTNPVKFDAVEGPWLESCESTGMRLDGLATEAAYRKPEAVAAVFHWTKEQEARYRSQAASEEEYARYRPSPYRVAVTHDRRGIYFYFEAEDPAFSTLSRNRRHDDVAMWEDDCFDIFLQPPDGSGVWQVIFNTAGQVLLLQDESQPVSGSGIEVATVPNDDGIGYRQEVFIPYAALQLDGMPAVGTVWKLNLGRELHRSGQYTTWSQVVRNFGIGGGRLTFVDPSPEIKRLSWGNGRYGRNRLNGEVKEADAAVVLRSPSGAIYRTESGASGEFELIFPVSAADAGTWQLTISGADGTVWRQQPWEVTPPEARVKVLAMSPVAISGDRIYCDAEFALGNAEENFVVRARLLDGNGRAFPVTPLRLTWPEKQRLYIATTGLPAGKYQLELFLDDSSSSAVSEESCRILPAAW